MNIQKVFNMQQVHTIIERPYPLNHASETWI